MKTATATIENTVNLPDEVGKQLQAVLDLKRKISNQQARLAKNNKDYRDAVDQHAIARKAEKAAKAYVRSIEIANETLYQHEQNLADLLPAIKGAIADPPVGVKVFGFCPGVGTISKNTYQATRFAIER